MNRPNGTAASRYKKLEPIREPYLERARRNAIVTIPELFPPEGANGNHNRYNPFQSLGAYGVNNLASKLMLSLFPPHRPFFRLSPESSIEEELSDKDRKLVDAALGKAERRMLEAINHMRIRPTAYRSFRHLIVGGNFLIWVKSGRAVGYSLDQYVVRRAYNGDMLEAIIREEVPTDAVPDEVLEKLEHPMPLFEGVDLIPKPDTVNEEQDTIMLYTWFYKDKNIWRSHQEAGGHVIPGSEASYGRNKPAPILANRWFGQDGEDYGRAFADDYYGDLAAIEDLSDNLLTFAAIASKIVFTQDPSGITDPTEVRDSRSGDTISGDADEFKALGLKDKVFDFQAAHTMKEEIEGRLRFAFLLNTAVQRNAERVTAEEIRQLMNELQTAHGGTLSTFSDEYQLPLAQLVMADMHRRKLLPELKNVNVTIVTGVDALSRNQELQDLSEAIGIAAQLVGLEELWTDYDPREAARRIFLAKGIKLDGFERDPEEAAQLRQQKAAAPLLDKAVAPAINAVARTQGSTE